MNSIEFVQIWKKHAESLYKDYTDENGNTEVSGLLRKLNLNSDEMRNVKKIIEVILVDTHYSFLLGLDGCTNIGGVQQDYGVFDEDEKLVFESGELEGEAYEQFHENFMK